MTTRDKLILLALSIGCCVVIGAGTPSDRAIEKLKADHERTCQTSRLGIMAGYTACRLGIPLTNYLADVEAAWSKQLAERIAEIKP